MEYFELINRITEGLKKPLPGKEMQLKMSSLARIRELMGEPDPTHAIPSGVLILLFPLKLQNSTGIVLDTSS